MKIGFISLGCSKNLVDTETMMGLAKQSHQIVSDLNQADIAVVNSCSFIQAARDETAETLEELKAWKTGCRKLILTGCYVEEAKESLLEKFPFVDGLLNTGSLTEINHLIETFGQEKPLSLIENARSHNFDANEQRLLSTPAHYAYLKIGEGCSQHCSYCTIPYIRGEAIYKPHSDILKEASILAQKGIKELILIAQDLTDYHDHDLSLATLLKSLNNLDGISWIRLMYCYPSRITPELIAAIRDCEKIVKYLDMPIQHINDTILKRMNRNTRKSEITAVIESLRFEIPSIKLRSTVITGFPGETESQFQELADYIESTRFNHLGVFAYSNEPKAPSFKLRGQIEAEVKQKRFHHLMQLQQKISKTLNKDCVGKTLPILIDNKQGGRRTWDAPDIDGFVNVTSVRSSDIGQIRKVRIKKALEYDLIGSII